MEKPLFKQGRRGLALLLTLAVITGMQLTAVASASVSDLINGVELSPVSPQSAALDALVQETMDAIIDPEEMDTYQQLTACYDYFVDNMRYGNHMGYLGTTVADGVSCGSIYNNFGEVEGFGAVALTAGTGMCNVYASGFILMARKIGLDACLVEGSTRNAGGGYSYHKWAEIEIDGVTYLFDPQLEQDLAAAGLPAYSVFCKTYDQVPGRYQK